MSAVDRMVAAARGRLNANERPLRFLVAGGINTLFGVAIYPALLLAVPALRTHYLVALAIAQALSLAVAFTTYKLLVFRTRGGALAEFGRFVPFYLVSYGCNWIGLPFLVHVGGLDPLVAQLVFIAFFTVASYFWHSKVTFR